MIDIAIRVGLVYVFSIIGIHSGDPETGAFSIWACMEKTSCIICAVTTLCGSPEVFILPSRIAIRLSAYRTARLLMEFGFEEMLSHQLLLCTNSTLFLLLPHAIWIS